MVRGTETRRGPLWRESILILVLAVAMAVVVKTFLVQAFYIPSGSMEPTMLVDDKILVQKVSYWGGGHPDRGDVVVFDDPGGWLSANETRRATNPAQKALTVVGLFPTGGHLIKRVIGIGGDEVACCDEAGHVMVNGAALDEPYLLEAGTTDDQEFDVTVPKKHLWVMGDNRGNFRGSRAHQRDRGGGFLDGDDVIGKAWLRTWPWKRIGFLHSPRTFETSEDR